MMFSSLPKMTIDELLKQFEAFAIEQDTAIAAGLIARANRVYDDIQTVTDELKSRSGDQRLALLNLYSHPNMHVRLKAAHATLAVAPELARQALEQIAASREYPAALDAGMALRTLDMGIYKPT